MFDKNYNNNCKFSEQTVSYLYGEITAREKIAFEGHLENCSVCAGEITDFGIVRSSVLQWKEDFELLPTPKIEVLFNKPKITTQPLPASVKPKFRFSELFNILTPSSVLTACLAFILVFVGLLFFIQNFTKENQIAVKTDKHNSPSANNSELTKQSTNADVQNVLSNSNQNPDFRPNQSIVSPDKSLIVNERKIGNAKNIGIKAPINSVSNRRFDKTNAAADKQILNNKRQIPKLNNIEEEEEETSLRLTDLLDEIGGK